MCNETDGLCYNDNVVYVEVIDMKEIIIHKDSRMIYTDKEETFIYVCHHMELAFFGTKGILYQEHQIPQEEGDMVILQKHGIYTFYLPCNACILLTNLEFLSQSTAIRFFQSPFQHEEIKNCCIMIADLDAAADKKTQLLFESYFNRLGYLVLNYFSYHEDGIIETNESGNQRIEEIQKIIEHHLYEELTLVELANQLHLTPQYVSQLFKTYFGCSFTQYISKLRLYEAMEEVQCTSHSFLQIAMDHGFANVRSFQAAFQLNFGCTPKQYRRMIQKISTPGKVSKNSYFQNFVQEQKHHLPIEYKDQNEENYHVTLSIKQKTTHLHHTWKRLMTVGRARLLLVDDIRRQLLEIQQDIGFEMIRFHGIFNDDMHVYDEDENGNSFYDFHQVNDALDFILKAGLKPFIELGFMPSKMAKYQDIVILNMFHVSSPKDLKKWQELVCEFLKNCMNRYGIDEVKNWYFEFWNNGGFDAEDEKDEEAKKLLFWQESVDSYLAFYEATYQAVKSIDPAIRIGGPAVEISTLKQEKKLSAYLQFMKRHHCMIDFLTLHVYPATSGLDMKQSMIFIEDWMHRHKLNMEVHISEWSTWKLDVEEHFNDNCIKAGYILHSILETMDRYSSLGHWTFTDYTETMRNKHAAIYSNNVGLFTGNGIKKAGYNAYALLSKLGDQMIAKGDHYIFTKKSGRYQLLIHAGGSLAQKQNEINRNFQFNIYDLPDGTYEKKVYYLNPESGSSFDVWKQMGSQKDLMEEDVIYLKGHAMMSFTREMMTIKDHQDHEIRQLKEQEAILVEWIYKF